MLQDGIIRVRVDAEFGCILAFDGGVAEDSFQATILAIGRRAGKCGVANSLKHFGDAGHRAADGSDRAGHEILGAIDDFQRA